MATQNNGNNHSFYKEAKKSFYGNEGFTSKKFLKGFKKLAKWSLYLLLTVTTLWGCVNEFILTTGNELSQGIEFYSNKDLVLPNFYSTEKQITWEAVNTNIVDENGNPVEGASELAPFNMETINPNYDGEEEADLVISSEEAGYIYSYQLTGFSTLLTQNLEILAYDKDGEENPLYVNSFSSNILSPGLTDTEDPDNQILNWNDYYNKKLDDGNLNYYNGTSFVTLNKDDQNIDQYFDIEILDDQTETCTKKAGWYAKPRNENNPDGQWDIVGETISTSTSAITVDDDNIAEQDSIVEYMNDESKYLANKVAFITGDSIATDDNTYFNQTHFVDENGTTGLINNISIADYVVYQTEYYLDDNNIVYNPLSTSDIESYTATLADDDVNTEDILTTLNPDDQILQGEEYFVVPSSKANPVIPTYDALFTMQALRPENWADKKNDLRENNRYIDGLTQVAGWGLLDKNGNLQIVGDNSTPESLEKYYMINSVYDSPTESFYDKNGNFDSSYGMNEDQYLEALNPLFAQQRTAMEHLPGYDSGDSMYDSEEIISEETGTYVNFDEMMSDYQTSDNIFTTSSQSYQYGSDSYLVSYETNVVGMSTLNDSSKAISDQVGVTTRSSWLGTDIYRTSLDNSMRSAGYKPANSTRGIFAGWGDWGWSWNVKFGPLYGLFLFPISQVALFIQSTIFPYTVFGAWGVLLGVFFIVFLLRGLGTLMSFKSTSNQQKMQEVQVDVAKINAKYEKYGDNKQMKQRKQMEVMALYRKKEVNPLGSFGTIFITMPIFISMWILISAIPVYKIAAIGQFSFATSSLFGIFSPLILLYLMVGLSVGLMQGVSAKLPGWLAQKRKGVKNVTEAEKAALKKSNKTQNIMIGVFIVIGLTVPVLLAFYWISSAAFTICLELGRHWYKIGKSKKIKAKK
ncbi:MAG: hypothetical protein GQ557_01795 [Mycoplasmataceae bacterium]|nr:hypothetical protein [Mycoplasmataceae bacterium]